MTTIEQIEPLQTAGSAQTIDASQTINVSGTPGGSPSVQSLTAFLTSKPEYAIIGLVIVIVIFLFLKKKG